MYINGMTITTTKAIWGDISRKINLDKELGENDLFNITINPDIPDAQIWKPSKMPCNNTVRRRLIIDDSIEENGEG